MRTGFLNNPSFPTRLYMRVILCSEGKNPSSSEIQLKTWKLLVIQYSAFSSACSLHPLSQNVQARNSITHPCEKNNTKSLPQLTSTVFQLYLSVTIILISWQEPPSRYITIHPLSSPQTQTTLYRWNEYTEGVRWEWFMNLKVCMCAVTGNLHFY